MSTLTNLAIIDLILSMLILAIGGMTPGGTVDQIMSDFWYTLDRINAALKRKRLLNAAKECCDFVTSNILAVVMVGLFVLSCCQLLHDAHHKLEDNVRRQRVYEVEKNRQRLPGAKVGEKIFLEKL